jgi:Domain of unknown function (DUF4440)
MIESSRALSTRSEVQKVGETMRRLFVPRIVLLMICALSFAKGVSGIASTSADEKIISLEKQLWEAWRNKDGKTFEDNLSPDTLLAVDTGIFDKTATVRDISSSNCDVKDYALSGEKVTWLDKTTALLTYKSALHATCNGQPIPEHYICSSVYVKRGTKWLSAFHQETAAVPAPPQTQP